MARTLFFHTVLRKFIENTNNQFLVSTILFAMCSDIFSIIIQSKNNEVFVIAHFVFVFCYALTTSHCNAFQHIFVNQKKL